MSLVTVKPSYVESEAWETIVLPEADYMPLSLSLSHLWFVQKRMKIFESGKVGKKNWGFLMT